MRARIKHIISSILFAPGEMPEPQKTPMSMQDVLYFASFVKPVWKLGTFCLVLSLIPTAIRSLAPLSGKVLIDFTILQKDPAQVEQLLRGLHLASFIGPMRSIFGSATLFVLLMLVAGMLIGLLDMISQFLMTRLQQGITFNLQIALFDRILRYPLAILKKHQVGYLMSRATGDVNIIQSLFSNSLFSILTSMFNLCLSFAILYNLNRRISLVILCVFPFNVLVNRFYIRRLTSLSYESAEASAHLSSNLQEVLSGVEVIKSHGAEERELHKISRSMRTIFNLNLKSTVLASLSGYVMSNLNRITTLFITWLAALEVMNKTITIGDLTAFIAYSTTVSAHLNGLLSTILNLQPSLVSLRRLTEMFHIVPEFEKEGRGRKFLKPDTVRGEIVFQDVSFSYVEHQPVLQSIGFTVHPGDIIALTGVTGAGKTTLINLILKFNIQQSGIICLDGHDLRDIDPRWLRSQIGIVSQDIFLFNDTIEHNIKYGNPAASLDEVIRVARQAHIHEEIAKFEDGYNTVVGERGIKLSVGQRQRISLARAFLKNAPLLIFDEPTSALDPETEGFIKDSLMQLTRGRTTFIITHHMSMVDIATRIFHLSDGRILERPGRNGSRAHTNDTVAEKHSPA